MRMLGITMDDGNPLERAAEIRFNLLHNVPREALQIGAVSELGRDNEFPEELVFARLPFLQSSRDIHASFARVESRIAASSALSFQITAMGTPLPARRVPGVCDSDGTALAVRKAAFAA
jgi:hypothetical protein